MQTPPTFFSRLAGSLLGGILAVFVAMALLGGILQSNTKAADYLQSQISTLVIRASRGSIASNGFLRLYSPNGSNSVSWLTNGVIVYNFNGVLKTGFSGTIMTNTVSMQTQSWFGGIFLGTNQTAGSIPSAF